MSKSKGILDNLTPERWQSLEAVYAERKRAVPWDGWRNAAVMHLTTGLDERTEQAASSNVASLLIALTHAARVGLLLGDEARLVSRAGVVRYHVGPDGRARLGHQAGILIRSGAVYDCDTFECDLGDALPVVHKPNLIGRAKPEAVIVGAWASGEWYDGNGEFRRAKAIADRDRLDTGAKHGDKAIWDAHPAKMAANTAIKDLWRFLPRNADMDALTSADHEPDVQAVADVPAAPAERAITYGADTTTPEVQP